jgi:hypothetical protein
LACIDWVGHGFEIVQSIFPEWKFSAADTVAAFGLHGALLIGARHSIAAHAEDWSPSAFELRNRFEARNRARLHTGAAVARQLLAVADEVVGTWASGDLAAAIRKLGQRCPLSTEADVNSLNPDAHASLQQNAAAIYRPKVKPYRALVNTTPS